MTGVALAAGSRRLQTRGAFSLRRGDRWRRRTAKQTQRQSSTHHQKTFVQNANQPSGIEVVFHQPASEIADAQLADRRGKDHVARADIHRPDDAGEDDDLPIAVDFDFAHAFDHQIAARSTSETRASSAPSTRPPGWSPLPLKSVLDLVATSAAGSTAGGSLVSSPKNLATPAVPSLAFFSAESADPLPVMLSITRIVIRSLTLCARGSSASPDIHAQELTAELAGFAARASCRYLRTAIVVSSGLFCAAAAPALSTGGGRQRPAR